MTPDLAGLLAGGRSLARALMQDACELRRPGQQVWDEDAGEHTTTPGALVYAGACRVQRSGLEATRPAAGERIFTVERVQLHVPLDVVDVQVGDVATITASTDPALVGRRLRVATDPAKTHATARRLACEDVTA